MARTAPAAHGGTHHDLPVHEVLLVLETDPHRGLTEEEAERRLEQYGPNELPRLGTSGPLVRLLRQLNNPLVYVLLAAGVVTFVLGEYIDSSVIFGVVVVNTIVGYIQESKAESALDALRAMVHTDARVVRGGHQRRLHSENLVPGDLVVIEAGDKVPADLRVVTQTELHVDESTLTGESVPVPKDESVLPTGTPVADRRNMAYSGTLVTTGNGLGIAVATGDDTEIGEIHQLVGAAEALATPLTRKLARFSKILTVVILALAAVTFAIGVTQGKPAVDMFTAAVALAVGAIPEGLPAAVTIMLAIGVARMARRRAVIRRLPAVETLGGATVICTDKTGTLTENKMTVQQLWSADEEVAIADASPTGTGFGDALTWCLLAGANCNDARLAQTGAIVGDPTEAAMLAVARDLGTEPHGLPRLDVIPFSSERQFMATLHSTSEPEAKAVLAKGAVERVLAMCDCQMTRSGDLAPLDIDAALEATARLAAKGLRVLATAMSWSTGGSTFAAEVPGPMVFTGLQAMQDPPRDTARAAVASCRDAGIAVKMITGDHAATAEAVARQIGLLTEMGDDELLTGVELNTIDEDQLPEAAERAVVLARVSPEQKLRLVEALQSRGHIVAMTGDGVNDAPALKQADIGVAMGKGGTEVAKEAGDMVLTDDDFATIEAAVEEGRGVFDNLTKFIVWTLPTNMGEALVIMLAVFLASELPILPTQILWINMTTAVTLGLMLAWEPKEEGLMRRPPRNPAQSLITGALAFRTVLVAALMVAGAWWVFEYELTHGASLAASRTAAVNVFVAVELFYLFSCRSLTRPVWRLGFFSNRWLIVGVSLQVLGQLAITYLPSMNLLFHTAPIGVDAWLRILVVALIASLVVAADKLRLGHATANHSSVTAG